MKAQLATYYSICNLQDTEEYNKYFVNETEARHWIINHLDVSKEWWIIPN